MSDQQPIDPGAKLVKRVRTMMMISGATTLIALAVILAVIGYRVFKNEGSAPVAAATVSLPKGARVISTTASAGRLAVTIEVNDAQQIRVFDMKTLKPTGQLNFTTQP